jgi:hypothetical protein
MNGANLPRLLPWYHAGMEENPYKAPEHGSESERKHRSMRPRHWFAAFLAVPPLLISCFCLCVLCLAVAEIIAPPWGVPVSWSEGAALISFYSASTATWAATAWATWKGRSRLVIASLLADVTLAAVALVTV